MLFKEFGGVDAFPICLATKDADEIVATVKAIAPVFGGINLEDISAPRCFEIEERLRDELDIPVFHDDQHGTAIVVLAALHNALEVVGKRLEDVRVVVTGVRRGRRRRDEDAARRRRRRRRRLRPRGRRVSRAGRGSRRCKAEYAELTNPRGLSRAPPTRRSPAPTSSSASPQPGAVTRRGHPLDGRRTRSSSRWRTRRRRSLPEEIAGLRRRRSARAARTTRTRSTTCSPSPASSAARSTSAPPQITERDEARGRARRSPRS